MQLVYSLLHFEPHEVRHRDVTEVAKELLGGHEVERIF